MIETRSVCCYCGTGCGVIVQSAGDRIVGVRGDPEHPANFGRVCTKGAPLHLSARPETRLLYPELRPARGEPPRRRLIPQRVRAPYMRHRRSGSRPCSG